MSVRAGWSRDKKDWQNLVSAIEKNGINWNRLKNFNLSALIGVPDAPGLYMLCSTPPENKEQKLNDFFTPLYIGKSKELKTRLMGHIRKPQRSVKDAFKISTNIELVYTKCNIENLDEVENCLIKAFGPITNLINAKTEVKVVETIKASLGNFEKIKSLGD